MEILMARKKPQAKEEVDQEAHLDIKVKNRRFQIKTPLQLIITCKLKAMFNQQAIQLT